MISEAYPPLLVSRISSIDAQNLTGLFAKETPFNSELIKQFYATLYVSGNPEDTSTWMLEWMIQGEVFRMDSTEFMDVINIPRHTGAADKVHTLEELTNAEFASLCDPNVTGDAMPENIRPKHLIFISKAWFYILSQSLMPLSTASDESNIQHHVRHAILKLTHGYVFDFEDCFLRYMVQDAELVHQLKPYAPWLMPICNYGRN